MASSASSSSRSASGRARGMGRPPGRRGRAGGARVRSAGAGSVEDDIPFATMHGLYWLVANLAARRPLVIAVDDAHWADAPSLHWLAHLAARIDGLPVALLLAVRSGPDEPGMLDELRACPACTPLRLRPLGREATATFVRGSGSVNKRVRSCAGVSHPHRREPVPARIPGRRTVRGEPGVRLAHGREPRARAGRPGGAAADRASSARARAA